MWHLLNKLLHFDASVPLSSVPVEATEILAGSLILIHGRQSRVSLESGLNVDSSGPEPKVYCGIVVMNVSHVV